MGPINGQPWLPGIVRRGNDVDGGEGGGGDVSGEEDDEDDEGGDGDDMPGDMLMTTNMVFGDGG